MGEDHILIEHDCLTGDWHVIDLRGLADTVTVQDETEADDAAVEMAWDLGTSCVRKVA